MHRRKLVDTEGGEEHQSLLPSDVRAYDGAGIIGSVELVGIRSKADMRVPNSERRLFALVTSAAVPT